MEDKTRLITAWKASYASFITQEKKNPGIDAWQDIIRNFRRISNTRIQRHIIERLNGSDVHFFASINETEILAILLENGCSPNSINSQGQTPLHIAAEEGNADSIEYLLHYKANPNRQDSNGLTPLHQLVQSYPFLNASKPWKRAITLLLRNRSNTLLLNQQNETALAIAQKRKITFLIKKLRCWTPEPFSLGS